jgi:hypothetical protein
MKLKKLDYVVIIILILFTIVSFFATLLIYNKKYDEKYVEIQINGKFYKKIPLDNHEEIINITTTDGTNSIEISKGKVHILDADCRDKICIKDGYKSNVGEMLVCLPHKVVIQIKGQNKQAVDDNSF